MSAEPGLLGLYWPERREALSECVGLCLETFRILQANGYDRFFTRGASRRDARKHAFVVSAANVSALLEAGVHRRDLPPREPIVDLGWRIGLWSGDADDEAYSLSIHCGSYVPRVRNNVLLQLPPGGPHSLIAASGRARSVYEALLDLWHPTQAVLCSGRILWDEGRIAAVKQPICLLT